MKVSETFSVSSVGIATSRDDLTIDYSAGGLVTKVQRFASLGAEDAKLEFNLEDTSDWKTVLAQADINQQPISEDYVKKVLYRPFDFRYTYYTGRTRGFISRPRYDLIRHMLYPNIAAFVGRQGQAVGDEWDLIFCGNLM